MTITDGVRDHLGGLSTELFSAAFENLDALNALEILELMNAEDEKVILVMRDLLPVIARVVERIAAHTQKVGRVIYVGAGTSGRIGALDASEIRPTFGVLEGRFVALKAEDISGLTSSLGKSEDLKEGSFQQLNALELSPNDVVIGIAASGRTPYVMGALNFANEKGCLTVAISANLNSKIAELAKETIEFDCGPEVLSGSTRLKAGTAQKLVLNMISTALMTLEGHTYRGLMVDMLTSNEKLKHRAVRMVALATNVSIELAEQSFKENSENVRQSIVAILLDVSAIEAAELLRVHADNIHSVVNSKRLET